MPIVVSYEDEKIERIPDTRDFKIVLPVNPSCRVSFPQINPIRLPNCLQHKFPERLHFRMTSDYVLPTFVRQNNLQSGRVLNNVWHSVSTLVLAISLEPYIRNSRIARLKNRFKR